jgi:hypothetical protein
MVTVAPMDGAEQVDHEESDAGVGRSGSRETQCDLEGGHLGEAGERLVGEKAPSDLVVDGAGGRPSEFDEVGAVPVGELGDEWARIVHDRRSRR